MASETRSQIRLKFPTLEEAQNYAAHGLAARVDRPRTQTGTKVYADNFRHDRVSWSH